MRIDMNQNKLLKAEALNEKIRNMRHDLKFWEKLYSFFGLPNHKMISRHTFESIKVLAVNDLQKQIDQLEKEFELL